MQFSSLFSNFLKTLSLSSNKADRKRKPIAYRNDSLILLEAYREAGYSVQKNKEKWI